MNYIMPVKVIKNILLKEHKSFIQSLQDTTHMHDYNRYLIAEVDAKVSKLISLIETYENCEDFIGDSRRMSLSEWIDSL